MSNNVTVAAAIDVAAKTLATISDTAKLDAELLLLHILKKPKSYLFTWPDTIIHEQDYQSFCELVAERKKGRPVAHLIGQRDFWTLTLQVNDSTLIPRPDTETLIEAVLASVQSVNLAPGDLGLDLGTGTGAIALSLASELPQMNWLGVDFSHDAVALAKRNSELNQINNCRFLQSDWFSSVPNEKYKIIVSNPPYIDPDDEHLNQGDVRFEPKSALIANDQGRADLAHIIAKSIHYITSPGLLVLEHGYDQAVYVSETMREAGFKNVKTWQDLGQNDRITVGYF